MKDAPAPADRYPGPRTKRQRTMTTSIRERLDAMRAFYAEGHTREPAFRKEYLRRLQEAVKAHEQEIAEALYADLHKSAEESYISETAIVLAEIRDQLRHLERRARSRRVPTPLFLFPSASRIIREPQGVVLVMAPWNYSLPARPRPAGGGARRRELRGAETLHNLGPYLPPHREHPRRDISPGLRVGF